MSPQAQSIRFTTGFGLHGVMYADFSMRLQHAGKDFRIYANDVTNGQLTLLPDRHRASDVLLQILKKLFTDELGVECVIVKPFRLEIAYGDLIDSVNITEAIVKGITKAGYEAFLLAGGLSRDE